MTWQASMSEELTKMAELLGQERTAARRRPSRPLHFARPVVRASPSELGQIAEGEEGGASSNDWAASARRFLPAWATNDRMSA